MDISSDVAAAALRMLGHCGNLKAGESLFVLADPETSRLGGILTESGRECGAPSALIIDPPSAIHGMEPSSSAAAAMQQADLIACVTIMSKAHTQARLHASRNGARFLSLPDYSLDMLTSKAMSTDFRSHLSTCSDLAARLSRARHVEVASRSGTRIRMEVTGRTANACPGCVLNPGDLGSPPDIEVNIAPLESSAEGIIVVDGSITCPEIGLLKSPLVLQVLEGRVVDARGDSAVEAAWHQVFLRAADDKAWIIGELGIGLNPNAQLTGIMLTDEGALGTVHFGLGSNATIGGLNQVPFHLDCVIRDATVLVDGRVLIDCGRLHV